MAMDVISTLTGERSDTKVAAVFDSEARARQVAQHLRNTLDLQDAQVQVVTPQDSHPGRKMEPEGSGIFRTMLIAHYKLGLAGLVLGALVFGLFYARGVPFVVNSPWMAAMAIVGLGGFMGLIAGGLVTLRPDHTPMLAKVGVALDEGRVAVVVHAFNDDQRDRARTLLDAQGGETARTL
jgi:hypothetical protein